jgi:S-adenosylmethionine hydrolase
MEIVALGIARAAIPILLPHPPGACWVSLCLPRLQSPLLLAPWDLSMSDSLITLTTDFGADSPFAAAMKGIILSINPNARLVDLSHDIPPFDLRHASFFLAESVKYFPPGTIHVVVVDPGVGGDRAILFIEIAGQRLLAPDNGCWTLLALGISRPPRVIRLSERRFWRPHVSSTFHGRDIFAPVAAHLSLGLDPQELGPGVQEWQKLSWPTPSRQGDAFVGEVIFVDHFGNLITNISGANLMNNPATHQVTIAGSAPLRRVTTYSEANPGDLVALVSSSGLLEVAESQGNAARTLSLGVGAHVRVECKP